jgi:hypothetical protein
MGAPGLDGGISAIAFGQKDRRQRATVKFNSKKENWSRLVTRQLEMMDEPA